MCCPFSERHPYILLRHFGVSDPYLPEASQNQRRYPAPPIFSRFGVVPFTMFGMGGGIGALFFLAEKKMAPQPRFFFTDQYGWSWEDAGWSLKWQKVGGWCRYWLPKSHVSLRAETGMAISLRHRRVWKRLLQLRVAPGHDWYRIGKLEVTLSMGARSAIAV